MRIDIRVCIEPSAIYWSDNGNQPNWDDPHYLWELTNEHKESILAQCLYSENSCHQVIYKNQVFWISDNLLIL